MPLFGIFSTLSVLLLFYILAKLSERFGSVIKMKPIYRYYYAAGVLVVISFITHLLAAITQFSPGFLLLTYHLPLAIGVSISLVITWRYWRWLVTERDG